VRKFAAEQLYVRLLTLGSDADSDDEAQGDAAAMEVLSCTRWDADVAVVKAARAHVCARRLSPCGALITQPTAFSDSFACGETTRSRGEARRRRAALALNQGARGAAIHAAEAHAARGQAQAGDGQAGSGSHGGRACQLRVPRGHCRLLGVASGRGSKERELPSTPSPATCTRIRPRCTAAPSAARRSAWARGRACGGSV
jgi:hypothetical protein